MSFSLRLLTTCALLLPAGAAAAAPKKVDYNFQIRPLLSDRCFACHGPDPKTRKAKLRLDTREGVLAAKVIVSGKPEESELVRRITAAGRERMPPVKSNLHLTAEEIALVRRWVAEGAEQKPHWAYLSLPAAVPLPAVSDSRWPTRGLDYFVLERLEREGLRPSPAAAQEDWLRRATFDLTGLPPTPAEVDQFLADRSEDAFERAADRLLASPRFGERMAQDWLDVARYADSFGYHTDSDNHAWPWRDWVVRAYNDNLPFDRFMTWQLAGDLLDRPTRDQRLATAFNRLNRMTNEGGTIPEEFRQEYVADRVQTVGTAFLGLTVECARCHDHKYDPLTTRDYYSLGAFFNSIDEWGTYDDPRFRPTPTLALPTPAQERRLEALAAELRALKTRVAALPQARAAAFREWLSRAPSQLTIPGLVGHYPLDKSEKPNVLPNLAAADKPGSNSPANPFVPGRTGQALRFGGDEPALFPNVLGTVDRDVPFTATFWLKVPQLPKQAVIFHRQGGADTGFHGVECGFEDGRLRFGLIRFWPGSAAVVKAGEPVRAGEWFHVAVSHDGSGTAGGLRIYVNGKPVATEVVRDGLRKNIEATGGTGLAFGARFRSFGLKDALLDEVRLYDRALSPLEVAHLHDGKALAEALTRRDAAPLADYYFSAVDAEALKALAALRKARQALFAAGTEVLDVMTMAELPQPRPAYVLARGSYDAPKDRPAPRATPPALPPYPAGAPRDRLGLARWLTDPAHPLTARVAVNRYWQLFFGRGLVRTPENFGVQGALPSHPELLDWLARDFIASGWDVKRLCKTIVLSSTYRQRSAAPRELRERDPENVLLARGPARRLSAEMLRDAALFAGGLLTETVGGPPVKPYQPPGLWKGQNPFLPEYVQDKGAGLYRRSLYTFWRRTSPPPNMTAFDAPSREVCVARRPSTSTPLQALVLLNDPQYVEAARGLGERMPREGGGTLEEKLTFAFRVGATRPPSERELQLLKALYQSQLEAFRKDRAGAQKYVKAGDRPPAAGLDPAELAAAAATANAILNLDAAVMVR